jgi:hypothetical protein
MTLSPEDITSNFDKYRSFFEKIGDRSEEALALVDHLGERLAICPASSRKEFHAAWPGGLVDHSLRVLGNALKLCKTFGWDIPRESLIIGALLHDIGKCGLIEDNGIVVDYYTAQDSDWHRDKLGEMYKINKEMSYMSTRDRSIHTCQYFGLHLTKDEYLAILLNDGFVLEENRPYCMKINPLVFVIMTADYIASMQEKDKNWSAKV